MTLTTTAGLALATENVLRRAIGHLLIEWDRILADEFGERIADTFTRLEILELGLDDFEHQVERQLGASLN